MADFRQPEPVGAGSIRYVPIDSEAAYRAVASRDARFDGHFITAVRTTGIYCRPSCPAVRPKRENVDFYPTAAAAQSAGFRACRRCLPDAVPGSPEWNLRADLAARSMRLISDGVVERDGIPGLARRLGYSERHLARVLTAELGAAPLALARAHRAHSARLLIESTDLPFSDIAFASGFASIRQFNDTVRAVFATTPSQLRTAAARHKRPAPTPGRITLRLPFRPPMDSAGLLTFLAARAVPGVEEVTEGGYARTLRLAHGPATARLTPNPEHVECSLWLADLRDLGSAVSRLRRLLDLDADPAACDELLAGDPALAASVAATPGIRLPGAVDGSEVVLRALLGQQVSVAAARTALTRLVTELGEPLQTPDGSLTRLFPTPEAIAAHAGELLTGPRRRTDTVLSVSAALANGSLTVDVGRDPEELRAELEALPGVGPWTAGYVVMRVLGMTDVLLTGDLALRKGAAALGLPSDVDGLTERAAAWRPWRSYAGMHLWRAAAIAPPLTRRTT
ncbi:DNA-3-methyladenine glycosylase 2 [Kutzneria albida]|uniref:DNA-3-methyladenine glycosylase II n=1 Tax=Kutzneria albida DSM 43870 TaxID=1449976 RepID=W5W169_9PSEU|nr:DNA-3-methyladenine glycosylase 2 [Kutzneria albida]AHH94276.1 putative bifunctional transcription activator/DNA repair enzyme AlkA [Kutzneria albida DSM 43870]